MLNNIWNALSTENIDLVNSFIIPLSFVENFLIMLLFVNLLNINCSNKQKFI